MITIKNYTIKNINFAFLPVFLYFSNNVYIVKEKSLKTQIQ